MQSISFYYNLYLKPIGNITGAVRSMEVLMQSGMSRHFLTCTFGTSKATFDVVSISSSPLDSITNVTCDTSHDPAPPNGSVCVVVDAKITLLVLFYSSQRRMQGTQASQDVLTILGDYLLSSMADGDFNGGNVVQTSFQGFVDLNDNGNGDSQGAKAVGGLQSSSLEARHSNSNLAIGTSVVAFAAVCFTVVAVVSIRYQNKRREIYQKHLEELSVSEMSLDERGDEPKAHLILDDDDSLDRVIKNDSEEDDMDRNVHICSSATCPVCRDQTIQPTFVPTASVVAEIRSELGPRRFLQNKFRSYVAADTVHL